MIGMVLLLAGLSVHYEGWTFFEGIYFAFITLSTIGFGDYLPSSPHQRSHKDAVPHYYVALFVLVTFFYITVGLSVVSSSLLSVSRMFETKTEWDFISLQEESDDEEVMVKQDYFDSNSNLNSIQTNPKH